MREFLSVGPAGSKVRQTKREKRAKYAYTSRLPSRRQISGYAEFLPPKIRRKKIAAAVNAAEFVKFGQPLQKLRLTFSWAEPKIV